MLQKDRVEKVDKKMGSFVEFPYLTPRLWSLNCLKMCDFSNFVLILARNLTKSVKIIDIYASESSHYAHSENDVVYRGLSQCS